MNHCIYCFGEIPFIGVWSKLFKTSEKMCNQCLCRFEHITGESCEICGRPYDSTWFPNNQTNVCLDCLRWQNRGLKGLIKNNTALYTYNQEAKEWVAKWKYRGDYVLIKGFQKEIYRHIHELEKKVDIIIPVPLSNKRLFERGFNQTEAILSCVKSQKIKPILGRLEKDKQSKKNREERIKGSNPFYLLNGDEVLGKSILIVDDIYTTGTTIYQVAKVLQAAGSSEIQSFTLFR